MNNITRFALVAGTMIGFGLILLGFLGSRSASAAAPRNPVVVEAEDYRDGPPGVAFADTDGTYGTLRPDDPVDAFFVEDVGASGGLIGRTRDGEFLTYDLAVETPGIYELRLSVASGADNPGVIHVDIDGRRVGTVNGRTDKWFDWTLRSAGETFLDAGDHTVTLMWDEGANVNLDWFEARATNAEPTCEAGRTEAEGALAISGRFETMYAAEASRGEYVAVPAGSGGAWNGPTDSYVDFCFGVTDPGTYFIDTRLRTDDGDNSFYVSVDGGSLIEFVAPSFGGEFGLAYVSETGELDPLNFREPATQVSPVEFDFAAGDHTVRFYLRRDGAGLDYVELTSTDNVIQVPTVTPTPTASPVAETCDSFEDDDTTFTANDTPLASRVVCSGVVGDGAYGSTSGDVDVYAVELESEDLEVAALLVREDGVATVPYIGIFDSNGEIILDNRQYGGSVGIAGNYSGTFYVAVAAMGSGPVDPLVAGSGAGAGSTGLYQVLFERYPAPSPTPEASATATETPPPTPTPDPFDATVTPVQIATPTPTPTSTPFVVIATATPIRIATPTPTPFLATPTPTDILIPIIPASPTPSPTPTPHPQSICKSREDDGSIGQATFIPYYASFVPAPDRRCFGTIGDGPYGATTGDIDYFAIDNLGVGESLVIELNTPESSELDTVLRLYDSSGNLIGGNDDGEDLDSYLSTQIFRPGRYYVAVSGYPSAPRNPFDSSSGNGAGSTGSYELTIDREPFPTDCGPEDNGSFYTASRIDVASEFTSSCDGIIGDGPFGQSTGDFDMIYLPGLPANSQLIAKVGATFRFGFVDPSVRLYDINGRVIDSGSTGFASTIPDYGDYFLAVGAEGTYLHDPFASASGSGASGVGSYNLHVALEPPPASQPIAPEAVLETVTFLETGFLFPAFVIDSDSLWTGPNLPVEGTAVRLFSTTPELIAEPGTPYFADWQIHSLTTGQLVESTYEIYPGGNLPLFELGDGNLPKLAEDALFGESVAGGVLAIYPKGMPDMPASLDANDAYVVYIRTYPALEPSVEPTLRGSAEALVG